MLFRSGLLLDVAQQFSAMHLSIHTLNSRELKNGSAVINATFTVNGMEHLQTVIDRLRAIKGVHSVERA